MEIGAFRFTRINASVSSISIPFGESEIETGLIRVERAEPSQIGTTPFSLINFDTGNILVNWPISASFELLERANKPPIAFTYTGVGKMSLDSGETLFFDTTEFDIPSLTAPDGTVLPAKKGIGANINVTVIVAPVPTPLPDGLPLPSSGSFESLNSDLLARFPVEKMARQAFSLAGIRVTENFIGRLLEEYRRSPEKELQFYFPDEDKFEFGKLDGNFEFEFFETPEF